MQSGTKGCGITARAALLALLAVAALPACAGDEPLARNLIVVSLDTLRPDRLGCYGYDRPTSPNLDRFAAGGLRFDRAHSTSPWTKPSHASLFTGLYPHRNGVVGFEYPLADGVVHLAELLQRAGFQTAAVVSNDVLAMHGLERGFEHFKLLPRGKGPEPTRVTASALEWLAGRDRARPFFAFVHYNDAHANYTSLPENEARFVRPYQGQANGHVGQLFAHVMGRLQLSPEDARHIGDLYDAAICQLDGELGPLFARLESEGLLADTLVVVTSDHGEEFLDHGGMHHGHTQFEEMVRVPLLVRGPGVRAGTASAVPVSLVDLMPTFLDFLGLAIPPGLDGRSLLALCTAPESALAERALFFEADCAVPKLEERGILHPGESRAITRGRFKLHLELDSGEARLYDVAADPGETRDVRAEHPDEARALEAELREFLRLGERSTEKRGLTEEDLSRLRELGYAGGD